MCGGEIENRTPSRGHLSILLRPGYSRMTGSFPDLVFSVGVEPTPLEILIPLSLSIGLDAQNKATLITATFVQERGCGK